MARGRGRPENFGVTEPRSRAYPTEPELHSTCNLLEVLDQHHPCKSAEERFLQSSALDKLNKIVHDWVKELTPRGIKEANAKFFAFGSYFLQVDEFDDPIDTICIGPSFVDHEHGFFKILHDKMFQMNEVTGLKSVRNTNVPFMEFKLDGVPIKIVYASLPCPVISFSFDLHQADVLSMDDVSRNSLDGCRVTNKIHRLVPCNKTFTMALRTVKVWAKARGIRSNVIGFLGDSDWAILVGRICQAHPFATLSTIVFEFFSIFSTWFWPNPVMLSVIEVDPRSDPPRLPVWDPFTNGNDIMPIISPAFPCKNIRADASASTLRDMIYHFKCGYEQCKLIKLNNNWADLFVPFKFFEEYNRYVHIDLTAGTEEEVEIWKKIGESELLVLISKIEAGREQVICHICPTEHLSSDSCSFFIGLSTKKLIVGRAIPLSVPSNVIDEFTRRMNNQKRAGMEVQVDRLNKIYMKSRTWGRSSMPLIQY